MDAPSPVARLAGATTRRCREELLAARRAALETRDPEGIHRARVALRRLRAACGLFAAAEDTAGAAALPAADIAVLRALRGDARFLADSCGPTRDLDVFIAGAMAQAAAGLAAVPGIDDSLRAWRATALRLRRTRHDSARRALAGDVFAAFDTRLATTLPAPEGVDDATADAARNFARRALDRLHRKARKAGRKLRALDADGRHALRLRVKKLRYAATFFAGLFDPAAARPYIEAAAGLQDALGLANDRAVATRVAADIRAAARPKGRLDRIGGAIEGWLAARDADPARADGEEKALRRAWKRFEAAPLFWRVKAAARGAAGDGEWT
ncbi:MAG: CHAD domain-containing protein [Rhodospirillales bacterium]|nr:CHAD domain-containing protein [Rhodospirillales bacterium]QQS11482.1 MAG: CHAD domain-containing protein [Rhodospirillales bacterium]